jgi:hypothetical protein
VTELVTVFGIGEFKSEGKLKRWEAEKVTSTFLAESEK